MKFVYQYRTSDNQQHCGVITAASKEAAYSALKAKGIKPGRVEEAPGFFNKLFGKGKRWIAIFVLALISVAAILISVRLNREVVTTQLESMYEDRAQLFGDPVVISECEEAGWTNVFSSVLDCRLAHYAIPGRKVRLAPLQIDGVPALEPIAIADDDLAEIAQMKRMVNGMRRELAEYLADGGTVNGYLKRLDIRQRAEVGFYEEAQRKIHRAKSTSEWKAKNAELRAMGLPMVGIDPAEM